MTKTEYTVVDEVNGGKNDKVNEEEEGWFSIT